jgi:hypothetical protein
VTYILDCGRIYRLPSGMEVAAHPAMDETMRFVREPDAWDLYTRQQWCEGDWPSLTVAPDGRVLALRIQDGEIRGSRNPTGLTAENLVPTGSVLGCEICQGMPWPGDLSTGGHGKHEVGCPILRTGGE